MKLFRKKTSENNNSDKVSNRKQRDNQQQQQQQFKTDVQMNVDTMSDRNLRPANVHPECRIPPRNQPNHARMQQSSAPCIQDFTAFNTMVTHQQPSATPTSQHLTAAQPQGRRPSGRKPVGTRGGRIAMVSREQQQQQQQQHLLPPGSYPGRIHSGMQNHTSMPAGRGSLRGSMSTGPMMGRSMMIRGGSGYSSSGRQAPPPVSMSGRVLPGRSVSFSAAAGRLAPDGRYIPSADRPMASYNAALLGRGTVAPGRRMMGPSNNSFHAKSMQRPPNPSVLTKSLPSTATTTTTMAGRGPPIANKAQSDDSGMKLLHSTTPATMGKKQGQPTNQSSSSRSMQTTVTPQPQQPPVNASNPTMKAGTPSLASVMRDQRTGDSPSSTTSDPNKNTIHSVLEQPIQNNSTDTITKLNMDGSLFHVDTTENEIALVSHEPRPIEGTAGSRIRVTLGDDTENNNNSFLLLLDEDDGERTWQSKSWCNLPASLDQQLRRTNYVYHCCYNNFSQEWFLSARCKETNKIQYFWSLQSLEIERELQNAISNENHLRMVLGDTDVGQYIILVGRNGYLVNDNHRLPEKLLHIMGRLYCNGNTIARIRGLNRNGRFLLEEVVDNEESESSDIAAFQNTYHSEGLPPELLLLLEKADKTEEIHEIAMNARDGWLLIRDRSFEASKNVCSGLIELLQAFYARHKQREEAREKEIQKHRNYIRQLQANEKGGIAEDIDKSSHDHECQSETNQNESTLARRARFLKSWKNRMKQREKEDRFTEIAVRRLDIGTRVTVFGISTRPGDATVQFIDPNDCTMKIHCPEAAKCSPASTKHWQSPSIFTIDDLRRVTKYSPTECFNEHSELFGLPLAEDKYEAALISYHGPFQNGACVCKNEFSGISQHEQQSKLWNKGDRVHVLGYADGRVSENFPRYQNNACVVHVIYDDGTSYHVSGDQLRPAARFAVTNSCEFRVPQREEDEVATRIRPLFELHGKGENPSGFDEYRCAEKIDLRRLQKIVHDLSRDRDSRVACMHKLLALMTEEPDEFRHEICYSKLERCIDLEESALTMFDYLKGQPFDEHGCVVHDVQYQHKDVARRGRLFAVGRSVRLLDDKFPRTVTLQGIQSQLLAPLTGAFAHYVDSENSDTRLLCSLATQLGFDAIVPSLKDYQNYRDMWIEAIRQEHPDISKTVIKYLPNTILSGGTYQTWLRAVYGEVQVNPKVQNFSFRLYVEVHVLRDQLLRHPKFQWVEMERDKLRRDGVDDETVDTILFNRILQSCENEVLGIMHRSFQNHGWTVRAKIFDSLLVEKSGRNSEEDCADLVDALRIVEKACQSHGWDIRLVEKPLYGKQDDPIPILDEARAIVNVYDGSQDDDGEDETSQEDENGSESPSASCSIESNSHPEDVNESENS